MVLRNGMHPNILSGNLLTIIFSEHDMYAKISHEKRPINNKFKKFTHPLESQGFIIHSKLTTTTKEKQL